MLSNAKPQWTTQQKQAIEDDGGALLVSAAAGSGKTAVLVERAVRLITKPNNPTRADRLLIVTFTNAAAEELQSRIGKRIEEEIFNNPQNIALKKQRMLLKRAFIGTMDAFCQQLVKENFAKLGLAPDISVADENQLVILQQDCLEQTMEEMYQFNNFTKFASLYGRARTDKPAEELILRLYDFTCTLPYPAQYLQQFCAMYTEDTPFVQTLWGKQLLQYGYQGIIGVENLLKKAFTLAQQDGLLDAYLPSMQVDIDNIVQITQVLQDKEWDSAVFKVQNFSLERLKPVRGYEGYIKDQIKEMRATAKKVIEELQKYCFVNTTSQFEQDKITTKPFVEALCQAVNYYTTVYYQAKVEQKVLDFSDFEQLALQLLIKEDGIRTDIGKKISQRYDEVMVDEYQDTNQLQDMLYQSVAKEDGSNLFYVGDVKQSIYRFRKANPTIFLNKKNSWHIYDAQNYPAVLNLEHNFRSQLGVIEGINYIFEHTMSEYLGEINYQLGEQLVVGNEANNEPSSSVELRIIDADEQNTTQAEAYYIAKRITNMLQEKQTILYKGEQKQLKADDFCILLRARSHMPVYAKALEEKGLQVVCDSVANISDTPEVLALSAVLFALDNPGDDVHLVSAMLSPLFGFSLDDMVALKQEAPQGKLWSAVQNSDLPKVQQFLKVFNVYRDLSTQMSAAQLCEELVWRTGYMAAVDAMENGVQRKENIQQFMGWLSEICGRGQGYLSYVTKLLKAGATPVSQGSLRIPGRVTILTVHKSKGLEFPVCFFADAAHKFNRQDLNKPAQIHSQLGIGLFLKKQDVLYPTLPALAIRRAIEQEAMHEEMRILYVALTRAQNKLIITFAHNSPAKYLANIAAKIGDDGPDIFMLQRAPSFADWICMAALCHPQADPLLQIMPGSVLPSIQSTSQFVMSVEDTPLLKDAQTEQGFERTVPFNIEMVQDIINGFKKESTYKKLQHIPTKVSVSDLVKNKSIYIRKRPSFMYSKGLTAAESGTAQHNFMQYADLNVATDNLEKEIERLVEQDYISPEIAKSLDREGIHTFLNSDLARRMKQAPTLLREYDFITAIPAHLLDATLPQEQGEQEVLMQGIADALAVFEDGIEIIDYKTNRNISAQQLVKIYKSQLYLYQQAIQKKFEIPVNKLTIWSFSLCQEVDIPIK